MYQGSLPPRQGLYDPQNEHDNCGVGFVADIKGRKSHRIIEQGLEILRNLTHRGAVGADKLAGDGAGAQAGQSLVGVGSGGQHYHQWHRQITALAHPFPVRWVGKCSLSLSMVRISSMTSTF